MNVAIRINKTIYNEAKKAAKAECRTTSSQIEYWATLDKCGLENPNLPIEFIKEIILAKHQDKSLAETFKFEGQHDSDSY